MGIRRPLVRDDQSARPDETSNECVKRGLFAISDSDGESLASLPAHNSAEVPLLGSPPWLTSVMLHLYPACFVNLDDRTRSSDPLLLTALLSASVEPIHCGCRTHFGLENRVLILVVEHSHVKENDLLIDRKPPVREEGVISDGLGFLALRTSPHETNTGTRSLNKAHVLLAVITCSLVTDQPVMCEEFQNLLGIHLVNLLQVHR